MSIRRITRTIVIGVGPASVPDELVAAAVAETYAGDTVRLVYAVRPTVVTELDWAAVGPDGAGSGVAGAGMLAGIAHTLSDKRPGLTVEGLVREGIAATVLADAARDAALVIVGQSHPHAWFPLSLALARELACPVLVAGRSPRDEVPVVAVITGHGEDAAVLATAFDEAERRGTGLVVLRPWLPPPHSNFVLAETAAQKLVDEQVIDWHRRYSAVPTSVELRIGTPAHVISEHTTGVDMLVVGQTHGRRDPGAAAAVRAHRPVTLLVPLVEQLSAKTLLPDAVRTVEKKVPHWATQPSSSTA